MITETIMTYSNFKLVRTVGKLPDCRFFAVVDETKRTGFLWMKKETNPVEIFRNYGGFWQRLDDGKYMSDDVTLMAKAYAARNNVIC